MTKSKAVLCIPGLYPHPLRPDKATRPEKHPWFEKGAPLLAALETEFDIYAIGYAQTQSVDCVASCQGMRDTVRMLKNAGYAEIVLVGHSAGGIIAHQFATRFPAAGVTKILPVAAPYIGSEIADLTLPLPRTQVSYIKSLATGPRVECMKDCSPLAKHIEYCAVLCKVQKLPHDILVTTDSQWPTELRKEGLPAMLVNANHFEILKSPQGVATVTDLAKSKLVRWSDAEVKQASAVIYSKNADAASIMAPKKERPIMSKLKELIERK